MLRRRSFTIAAAFASRPVGVLRDASADGRDDSDH